MDGVGGVDQRRGGGEPFAGDRGSTHWLIASLAVELGVSPLDLERCSTEMLETIVSYLDWRHKEQEKARKKAEQQQARSGQKRR